MKIVIELSDKDIAMTKLAIMAGNFKDSDSDKALALLDDSEHAEFPCDLDGNRELVVALAMLAIGDALEKG